VASSVQGAADARSAFFRGFPATTKFWALWAAYKSLQAADFSGAAFGVTGLVNGALTWNPPDDCTTTLQLQRLPTSIRTTQAQIDEAAKLLKQDQALVDDFNQLAKTDKAASWYIHNTDVVTGFAAQIQTASAQRNTAVKAGNDAIKQAHDWLASKPAIKLGACAFVDSIIELIAHLALLALI
jgi:hypothetical protein